MPHDFSGSLSPSPAAARRAPPRGFRYVQDPVSTSWLPQQDILSRASLSQAQEEEEKDLELEDDASMFSKSFPQDH